MFLAKLKSSYMKRQCNDYIFFIKNYVVGRYVEGLETARTQHREKDYYCFVNIKLAINIYHQHYDVQDSNIIHNRQLQKEVFQKVFKELRVELSSESVRKMPCMRIFIGREDNDIFKKYLHYLKQIAA